MRHQFNYSLLKIVSYYLLAVIYDNNCYEKYVRFQMYHIVKDVASLITTPSGNDSFPIEPYSLDRRAQ